MLKKSRFVVDFKDLEISVQKTKEESEREKKIDEALEADFSGEVDVLAKSRRPKDE